MSSEKKWPFIQWFVMDWLGDPKVSRCDPATRGILFDWLCNMHALDRSGQITGSREELARLGRCSAVQCDAALEDLKRTNAADVTERNGVVTVVNRRMKRENSSRKSANTRQQRCRSNGDVTPPVTPHNQRLDSRDQIPKARGTEPYSTLEGKGGAGGRETEVPSSKFQVPSGENSEHRTSNIERPTSNDPKPETQNPKLLTFASVAVLAAEIMGNDWGWCYDNCKVKLTDFTQAGLMTVLKPFQNRATEKQVRAAWLEAVRIAHQQCVDYGSPQSTVHSPQSDPVRSPAGLATSKFKELLNAELGARNAEGGVE